MKLTFFAAACAMGAAFSVMAQEASTVVRDAETGKLRAPTPAELKALQAKNPQPKSIAPAVSSLRPDGTRSVNLGERGMVYAVAKRHADGTVSEHCVTDGKTALDKEDHHAHP